MDTSVEQTWSEILAVGTAFGMDVLAAIAILILGWMVAGWAQRSVGRALKKSERIDETLRRFFAAATRYLVLAIAVIAVLNRFGVQTASLVALLGAAGLAIGLALQGTLGNVAAGVLLLVLRRSRSATLSKSRDWPEQFGRSLFSSRNWRRLTTCKLSFRTPRYGILR